MDKPCDLNTVRASPPEATLARWSTNGILVKFKAASLRAQTSPVPIYPSLVRTQYTQSTQTRREVELVYASQAVRIQGQRVCRYNANYFSSPTAAWWYRTHSINLDLKAGWNEVLVTNIYADADKLNRTIIEGGAGSPPVVWAYVGDPSLGTPTP